MTLVANVELILISEMTLEGRLHCCFKQNFSTISTGEEGW
jgi:hypothetical protein